MKKILSVLLCVVICFSMFASTVYVANAANATNLFAITNTKFDNEKITYTISLKPNQKKVTGIILKIAYDSDILKVSSCTSSLSGLLEKGCAAGDKDLYAIAYLNIDGLDVNSSGKEFAKITFSLASTKRPKTTIKFYCYEYSSDDGNNNNDISPKSPQLLSTSSFDTAITLTAPVVNSLAINSKGISVKWGKVPYATKYVVYRKVDNAKTWSKVLTTTKTEYTDTRVSSGKTYKYTVKAYDGKKYSSYNTTGWSIKYLSIPKLSKIENTYSGPKIYWNKVSGATKYIVYRKTGSSSWTELATTTNLNYVDKTAKNNTTYKYTVRAISGSVYSYYNTNGLSLKCINPPKISKISKTASGINLEWNKISGASGYYVYRKAGNATSWTKIATTKTNKYVDKNVKKGTYYTYTLKAYNGSTISGYNGSGWKIKR